MRNGGGCCKWGREWNLSYKGQVSVCLAKSQKLQNKHHKVGILLISVALDEKYINFQKNSSFFGD